MGGHGGLNILPQKKWNVYNRDNREKVDRDKKKHAEKMKAQETRSMQTKSNMKYDIIRKNNMKKVKIDAD